VAASAGAIRAGQAYVEITARDGGFQQSMARMRQQMQSVGRSLAMAGAGGLAIGTSVIGSILAAAQAFADVGSELNDMSARTGVATDALSVLKFAAQQTGTDMAGVETGVRKMQKAIFAAAGGSEEAAKALGALGLTAQQLQGMSADEQIGMIADRLLGIPDAGDRAAVAMLIFGKSGTSLMPMLAGGSAGMAAFAAEAKRLGIVMDQETAGKADALGDAVDSLKASMMATFIQVGGAAAPILTQLAAELSSAAAKVGAFIAENAAMVVTMLKASAALVAVSAAVIAVGLTLEGLAAIIGAVQKSFSVFSSLSSILSPVGLVAVTVAAAIGLIAVAARQLSPEFKAATDAILRLNGAKKAGDSFADATAQNKVVQDSIEAAKEAAEAAKEQKSAEDKAAEARKKAMERGQQIRDQVATPEEKLKAQIKELQDLRDQGAVDSQTFARAIDAAKKSAVDDLMRQQKEVKDKQASFSSAGTFGAAGAIGIGPELAKLEDPTRQIAENTAATVDAIASSALGGGTLPQLAEAMAPAEPAGTPPAELIPGEFQAQLDEIALAVATGGDIAGAADRGSAAFRASMGAPPSPTSQSIAAETAAPRAVDVQQAADTGTQAAASLATLTTAVNSLSSKLVAAVGKTTSAVEATMDVLKTIAQNTADLGGSFV
jgi:hypothetical protein